MKTKIISTFLLSMFFVSTLFSQSALDRKNGFKDFALGDTYSKWSSSLTYILKLESGISVYKYTGTCCLQVFNYDIEEIRLGFEDNKLKVIWFATTKFQKGFKVEGKHTQWNGTKDFDKLKENLINLFDKPKSTETDDKTSGIKSIWMGEKVILTLEYEYLGINEGDRCNILVGLLDKSKSKDGF